MASLCQSNHSVIENGGGGGMKHEMDGNILHQKGVDNRLDETPTSSTVSSPTSISSSSSSLPHAATASSSPKSSTMSSSASTSAYGRILKEDVFECVSRNHDAYRLTLTTTHLLLQLVHSPYTADTLSLEDLFGCHTFRHKNTTSNTGAYICFFFYIKRKKGLFTSSNSTKIPSASPSLSSFSSSASLNNNAHHGNKSPRDQQALQQKPNSKYRRERTPFVFRVTKLGNKFADNLDIATDWKDTTLGILRTKFSQWQLNKFQRMIAAQQGRQNNSNNANVNGNTNGNGIGVDDDSDSDILNGNSNRGFRFSATKLQAYDSGKRMSITNGHESNGNSKSNSSADSGQISQNELDELSIAITSYRLLQRKFLVILNPKSGQGKTIQIFEEKVHPILVEGGIKVMLLVTERTGHARSMVSSADLSGIDGIATVGGDGLLYEVVNGLRSRADAHKYADIPLGVIAGGSGNGLARSIAAYSGEDQDYLHNPVVETTLAIARGKVIPVNLTEVELDGRKIYSFLSVGWGLLSDIDVESEVLRGIGEIRFFLWSFLRLANLRTYNAQLSYVPIVNTDLKSTVNLTGNHKNGGSAQHNQTGDAPVTIDGNFICVYSTIQSHIGSDLTFAPYAKANDGVIHLTFVRGNVGRTKTTQFLLGLDKGEHLGVSGVEYVPVKEFSLRNDGGIMGTVTIDGERVTGELLKVKLSPQPLNVFSL